MVKQECELTRWLTEQTALLTPRQVVWIDGTEAQFAALRQEACRSGVLISLNQTRLPGCYLHRSDPLDVARVEGRTYICTQRQEDAGPTNHWMDPAEMYRLLGGICAGSMQERTMYAIPYAMGPLDSPYVRFGVELTDSVYVALNMSIMSRVGDAVRRLLEAGMPFIKGVHCTCDLDPARRYIAHFPEDDTVISVNSGYGGNALLGKKCVGLRLASYLGRREGWLAEHMLILGVENPEGEVRYLAAAFPSACGKTNLAMLIPPERYQAEGWKVWCVGDDIAWLRVGEDGRLWAVNPEQGFFGVAPGTSARSNPNALQAASSNTIFTNVVRDLDTNTVWWEGLNQSPPEHAENWRGEPWNGKTSTETGAHPNSRFTAPIENCPCLSPAAGDPRGVPISAILFGGRRAKVAPLAAQALHWTNGVFLGAAMASETTAAAEGAHGVVRRDPMAMKPFCGYHMGDYWQHWLDMGSRLGDKAPAIFMVNWFRTDETGRYLWPGFGENLRVLRWILDRCQGRNQGIPSPVGILPLASELDTAGLSLRPEEVEDLCSVDPRLWAEEAETIRTFFDEIGPRTPHALRVELELLERRLKES